MDDVLVNRVSKEMHDEKLKLTFIKLEEAGIILNQGNCVFGVRETKLLGYVINSKRIQADPDKTRAIKGFPVPTSRT